MNRRYFETALENPCFFGGERTRDLYDHQFRVGWHELTVTVTLDDFAGHIPVWHITVQLLKNGEPVNLRAKLSRSDILMVQGYAAELLAAVGSGKIEERHTLTALEFTKRASINEYKRDELLLRKMREMPETRRPDIGDR